VVTFLLALIIAPFTLLTLCFAVELFAGARPLRGEATEAQTAGSTAVIIVPAHDEAAIIGSSLSALQIAAQGQAQILVVADNCTDSTAEIVRGLGIDVIERFDAERRGKGFALDFARKRLESKPPDMVLVIDADCSSDPQSIQRLIARCATTGRPCQAVYLLSAAPDAPPILQLSTFAFFIKNLVRQRALQRLANRVHLLGTGMALPWKPFELAELATANIVEDLQMGLELAEAGHQAVLVEESFVWSDPAGQKDTFDQRKRWEGGFLQNAIGFGPRFFARSLARSDMRATWAAVNVMIPPFVLLLLLDLAVLALGVLAALFLGAARWPMIDLAGSVALAGAGLIVAWWSGGWRFVSLRGLAQAPLYLLWKLPLYFGLARRGAPKEWVRTGRG
jgi:cellulose synthase/poly-beta-1,6-N-acetylglucosamine synthase-like glycosyltransferase